jgi:NAD-dependent SIR2 family protein deacetylase
MIAEQRDMRVPTELLPTCPKCGKPMVMNLRSDDKFVEDEGWHKAQRRYSEFLQTYANGSVLFLELGVGGNTPGIIKYPFWKMTYQNPKAVYCCINLGEAVAPKEIAMRSICVDADIGQVLNKSE